MKKVMLLVGVIAIVGLTAGCGIGGAYGNVTKNLANDNATVVGDVTSIYGRGKIIRTNPKPGQDVTITPDGTVHITTSTNHPVPLTTDVVPAPETNQYKATRMLRAILQSK
jgi:hypothetical protein